TGATPPDGGKLTFSLGPDELRLSLNVAGGPDPFELRRDTLRADLGEGQLLAYTEVLSEILDGSVRLSVRGDTAEECWRIIEPVQRAWKNGEVPLGEYVAGTKDLVGIQQDFVRKNSGAHNS